MNPDGVILGLDIGHKRIGVARAHSSVRLASPLTTLQNPDSFMNDIQQLCQDNGCYHVVLGLPRGLQGQDTAQTQFVRQFAAALAQEAPGLRIDFTDEALTSQQAEAELDQRKTSTKADVDALAATYILQDYLENEVRHG